MMISEEDNEQLMADLSRMRLAASHQAFDSNLLVLPSCRSHETLARGLPRDAGLRLLFSMLQCVCPRLMRA